MNDDVGKGNKQKLTKAGSFEGAAQREKGCKIVAEFTNDDR